MTHEAHGTNSQASHATQHPRHLSNRASQSRLVRPTAMDGWLEGNFHGFTNVSDGVAWAEPMHAQHRHSRRTFSNIESQRGRRCLLASGTCGEDNNQYIGFLHAFLPKCAFTTESPRSAGIHSCFSKGHLFGERDLHVKENTDFVYKM